MLLHQDGARHQWLEGQPALDLIVMLDDATSEVLSLFLVTRKGRRRRSRACARWWWSMGCSARSTRTGVQDAADAGGTGPCSSSGSSTSRPTRRRRGADRSGSSARFQDRLPKELRLAGMTTIAAANAWLKPNKAEGVERGLGLSLGLRHPDLLQGAPGFRLLAHGELLQNVRGLVHPTTLLARLGPELAR